MVHETSPSPNRDGLSPVESIALNFGNNLAHVFQETFGGRMLYIPARIGADHPISYAIGEVAAAKLASDCGSESHYIRHPSYEEQVRRLVARGIGTVEISRRLRLSERHVIKLRAGLGMGASGKGRS